MSMRPSELCNAERFEIEIGTPVSKASARKGRATSARTKSCILGKSHGRRTSDPREAQNGRCSHDNISTSIYPCVQNTPCHMQHAAQESVVKVREYVTVIILASWTNTWTSISSRFVEGGYEWSEYTRGGSPLDHRERHECMEFRHRTVAERCHKIKSSA